MRRGVMHKAQSKTMRNEIVQLVIALGVLAFGGAAEELLPKFPGVGFPVLLMACIYMATRRGVWQMFMFAAAAGAAEDSLASLPWATSIAFFCMAAAFARTSESEWSAYAFSYPVYQLWVRMWSANPAGGIFSRFLLAIPVGLATAACVRYVLRWLDRKGALDEA